MKFVAIDLETANADMSSICQIGIASFSGGELVSEWVSLVYPNDYFSSINVGIHGIDKEAVKNAPTFAAIFPEIEAILTDSVCVSHTHFDRVSLDQAIRNNDLSEILCTWLDSAKIARRAWEEIAYGGYGLKNVCQIIGYEFRHHDALEDAKACGAIVHAAIDKTGLDIQGWLTRVGQPISGSNNNIKSIAQDANPEGALYGQSLVFTGALSISRATAAVMASEVGCKVASSVTKKTNYLVVGDQDVTRLAGKDKSSKHIKAEQLITKGQTIRILRESDFSALVENAQ